MADSIKDDLAAAQGAASTASSSVSQSGTVSMPAYADQSRVDAINRMYDANINAQRNNLQTSYDQNMSNLEANRESIAKRYQQQRNAAATDYERQRRNFNEQAMMNGLATGVGSQAALAQNSAYQRQQGTINAAEGTDVTNLERSIADLKVKYQNDINSAIADNDYKRAAAMLDEYNMAYNRAQQEAQTKAQYGDFSGYEALFGPETANQMRNTWTAQNPGIAYSLGYIGADAYYQLTGRYPAGYSSGRGGSNSGGSQSGNGNPPPSGEPDPGKLEFGGPTDYSWQNDDQYLANLAANGGTRFDAQQNAAAILAASNDRIAAQRARQSVAQAAAQAQSQTAAGTFTDWDSSYRTGSGRTNRG